MAFDALLTVFPFHKSILDFKILICTLFIEKLTLYQHKQLFIPAGKHNHITDINLSTNKYKLQHYGIQGINVD
jgi:hypothetical protein